MKQFRLLTLLALLMTAATGAWAQTSDKETPLTLQATADGTITIYNPKDGMHYKVGDGDKQMVTSTDNVEIPVTEGQTVQFFGYRTTIEAYGVEAYADDPGTSFGSSVPCYIYGNIMSLVDELYFATATVLSRPNAFRGLFYDFSNLLNHPTRKLVLPATTLAEQCYAFMFSGCSNLTTAPKLPATTLASYCYGSMFSGCKALTAVTCLATDISAQSATDYWLYGVAATGTLTIAKGTEDKWAAKSTDEGIPSGWTTDVYGYKVKLADRTADAGNWTATLGTSTTAEPLPVAGLNEGDAEPDLLATPLTIEAITDGTIKVNITDEDGYPVTLETGMKYSVNGGDKVTIKTTTEIPVAKGDNVQFYGNGTQTQFYGSNPKVIILGSGDGFKTKVYGNIMSLLNEDNYATNYTALPNKTNVFYGLFKGNTTLTDASELLLPAETLTPGCYNSMFYGCTSLTTAPALPATQLAVSCYREMFVGCTALTAAPVLPATTLAQLCYFCMFFGCESLTSAYVKAAYTEERNQCSKMFDGCTADGAVLHTTSDNKASWEAKMGPGTNWDNWSVADDWQD